MFHNLFPANSLNENGTSDLREFMEEKGMLYGVDKLQACHHWQDNLCNTPNQFQLAHADTGKILTRSTVTKKYKVFSGEDVFQHLNFFVAEGFAKPHAAYHCSDGATACIALKLDLDFEIPQKPGDETDWLLKAFLRHGKGAIDFGLWGERLVCKNGMTAFVKTSGFRESHRGNISNRVAQSMKEWKKLQKQLTAIALRLGGLCEIDLSYSEAEQILDKVYKIDPSDKVSTQKDNQKIATMFQFNNASAGTFGNSGYDLYNAVTWMNTHYIPSGSKKTSTDILESLVDGTRGNKEIATLNQIEKFNENR